MHGQKEVGGARARGVGPAARGGLPERSAALPVGLHVGGTSPDVEWHGAARGCGVFHPRPNPQAARGMQSPEHSPQPGGGRSGGTVQPGLAGLMDGSVSTLAPIFATAFATKDSHTTLLVGLAASIGAGISMGFTEAVHDDGVLSGRGSPVKRGFASGIMTTLGGLGHALPYLITDFYTATVIAMIFVLVELWAIAWIQTKYMKIKFTKAIFQVVFGGSLVLAAGILIGGG